MINEPIILKEQYFQLASQIIDELKKKSLLENKKLVIGICGESGSGKSITAKCLEIELEKLNLHSAILHQDNYYKLTPKENHKKRKIDLSWVGVNEVRMDLLQDHITLFKSKAEQIGLPVVNYHNDSFSQITMDLKDKSVLIVEGVYSLHLSMIDHKIFMERTYKETLENRQKRSREVYDPFVEDVLKIEQSIILPLKKLAHNIITKGYRIRKAKI